MGLCTLVPVQEAFHVDDVANVQSLNSCVNIGTGTVADHVSVDGEGEGSVVEKTGDIENIEEFISNTGGDLID